MAYGLRIKDASGQIIIDGYSRMLRLHASGSLSFSFGAFGQQQQTENFTALDADPVIIGYFDPSIAGGWSMSSTLSSFTILAASASAYTGNFYYYIYRQR
jgi:hypothetical protein